jgi:hypothetical protein
LVFEVAKRVDFNGNLRVAQSGARGVSGSESSTVI